MAFKINMTLYDGYGRRTIKHLEQTDTILSDAQTSFALFVPLWAALSDLQLTKEDYLVTSTSVVQALVGTPNIDQGATFQLRLNDGTIGTYKIPGFKSAKVQTNGTIDVTDADVVAFFAQYLTGGKYRLDDGNYMAAGGIVSGVLDR